jgi:ubiquinone biosynthesis protein COQ9
MTQDLTLDEIREAIAPGIAANAAFDGWSDAARDMAAEGAGIDPDVARLAFPDGAVDMIDAWFAHIDRTMAAALPAETLGAMKIRERIATMIETRLATMAMDRESLRRALAILAGDTATDYNHYTKRTILLGVYGATVTVFLDDDSEGHAETRAFLARRIDGIMRFEKAKAGFVKRYEHRPSLSRFVGRLRYPAV